MEDDVIITHIPSLVATLLNREGAKGAPLTRDEVESIRDSAPCVALTPAQRAAVDARRQYDDIDPELAWEQWQTARIELDSLSDEGGDSEEEPSEQAGSSNGG
jgi:hypothetical protein